MTQVQFAFQGGGAKLGSLLAAAEAVYTQQKALQFTISRVSGTSAGAIVACMLATGENPAIFRQRLIKLANERLDEICKGYSYLGMGVRLWNGVPLYGTTAYRNFLKDLFDLGTKKWERLDQLDKNIDIFIHAVDIQTREPKIYKKGDGVTIVRALLTLRHCRLFSKPTKMKRASLMVELVNNFPSNILLDDEQKSGYVAGLFI